MYRATFDTMTRNMSHSKAKVFMVSQGVTAVVVLQPLRFSSGPRSHVSWRSLVAIGSPPYGLRVCSNYVGECTLRAVVI